MLAKMAKNPNSRVGGVPDGTAMSFWRIGAIRLYSL
jgi:hypothetical protein